MFLKAIVSKSGFTELIRYLILGLLNTFVGYIFFLIAFQFTAAGLFLANAFGYVVALTIAFWGNRLWVFKEVDQKRSFGPLFIVSFLLSFGLNQLTLFLFYSLTSIDARIIQLFGMLVYTVTFFALNKYVVFGSALQKKN